MRAASSDSSSALAPPSQAKQPATPPHLSTSSAVNVIQLRRPPKLMPIAKPRQFVIQGLTKDGRAFRPSDWAERLAGAMSCFRPGGVVGGISAAIGYSPLCVPNVFEGVRCVIVSEELRDVEPMAWDFVMNFARDNELQVSEAGDGAAANSKS